MTYYFRVAFMVAFILLIASTYGSTSESESETLTSTTKEETGFPGRPIFYPWYKSRLNFEEKKSALLNKRASDLPWNPEYPQIPTQNKVEDNSRKKRSFYYPYAYGYPYIPWGLNDGFGTYGSNGGYDYGYDQNCGY